jgi:hypothetical protein
MDAQSSREMLTLIAGAVMGMICGVSVGLHAAKMSTTSKTNLFILPFLSMFYGPWSKPRPVTILRRPGCLPGVIHQDG